MAIKNTLFGGTDWNDAEVLETVDVNDTFDAAYNKIIEKTTFWNDSEWFIDYDTFDSDVNAAKWDTDANGNVTWSNTNNANGDTVGEARVNSTASATATAYMISNSLPNNKLAYHFKGYATFSGSGSQGARTATIYFRERDGTTTTMLTMSSAQEMSGTLCFSILVLKTAADTYDVYCGGVMIVTISDADLEIGIQASGGGAYGSGIIQTVTLYIDDVRYTNE